MRIAAWLSIAFAVVSALAVFLPGIELQVGGIAVSRRASLSLWDAAKDRDAARGWLEAYQHAGGRHFGEKAADAMLRHAEKHAKKAHVDDARDAMQTLDEVSTSDVKTAGQALFGLTWGYVAVIAAFVLLAFGAIAKDTVGRRRVIAAAVVGLLAAAIAIGMYVAWGMIVAEANDEVGASAVGLGVGAFLMPIGGAGAFGAALAVMVMRLRQRPQADAQRA